MGRSFPTMLKSYKIILLSPIMSGDFIITKKGKKMFDVIPRLVPVISNESSDFI